MFPGTRALRTLEAAARHLNFTTAASEIGLTPAAVSHQIKELEDQLGVLLFTRTRRSVQLTEAGTVVVDAVAEALNLLQSATGRARRMSGGAARLRLSLSARLATNWFLPRLAAFRAANPDLDLIFDISDALRDFARDDIDIAIRFGAGVYPGARSQRLFGLVIAPVCSPRLLASGARLETPEDLHHHTLCQVDWQSGGLVWPNWRMWMAAAGVVDFDDSRCLGFPDPGFVVQAVIDGNAVGLADIEMIADDLSSGRLVRLFDIGLETPHAYHLVYPEHDANDPRILAFLRWASVA